MNIFNTVMQSTGKKLKRLQCEQYQVPTTTCYLRFSKGKVKYSLDIGYTTRGEQVIADFDDNNNIMGFELLDSPKAEKPCLKMKR